MIYVFDPVQYRALFPQFANLTDDQLWNFYYGSVKYWTPLIRGYEDNQAAYVINNVIAHLITMSGVLDGNSSGGRVASANTGSVSTSFAYNPSEDGWFWNSTSYGQEIYQLMLMHGGLTYVPGLPVRYKNRRFRRGW